MLKNVFKVKKIGEPTYLPAPEQGEPDGLYRCPITLQSTEDEEEEQDEINALVWDDMAFLTVKTGDKVLATLLFRLFSKVDGSCYQTADVVEIKKLKD